MAEQDQRTDGYTRSQRRLLVATALLLGIAVIFWGCILGPEWRRKSAIRRLAAIDSARRIPDDQNPAVIYNQLLTKGEITDEPVDSKEARTIIDALLRASQFESCYFPVQPGFKAYWDRGKRLSTIQDSVRLLRNAAKKDLADGRIDAALEKVHCLLRMGQHVRQQPSHIEFLVGTGIEGSACKLLRDLVMQETTTEAHLRMVEAIDVELANDWTEASRPMLQVQPLLLASYRTEFYRWFRTEYGYRQWLRSWWSELTGPDTAKVSKRFYMRLLSLRRSVRVLVALRRYRSQDGHWPDSLDEIRTSVRQQALIDPYTEQPFAYKVTSEGFRLSSVGPNGIDEDDLPPRESDDYHIWPRGGITSPQTKGKTQNAGATP